MIPQTDVYYVPGVSVDIFYSSGYWWNSRGGNWSRSVNYAGPWESVQRNSVPDSLARVPSDYRDKYKGEQHINYGRVKKNPQNGDNGGREHGR